MGRPKKVVDISTDSEVESTQTVEIVMPQRLRVDLKILRRQLTGTLRYIDMLISKNS